MKYLGSHPRYHYFSFCTKMTFILKNLRDEYIYFHTVLLKRKMDERKQCQIVQNGFSNMG